MTNADIAHLRAEAGMTTHFHPKHPAIAPPLGLAPLGSGSGLYLRRGEEPDSWKLEGRTWSDPALDVVDDWQRRAAYVAHGLDPGVDPLPAPAGGRPAEPARGRD